MADSSPRFVARKDYQLWLPRGYTAARPWPAILFLHGVGERGDDGVAQTTVGLGRALRDGKIDPPAIVIFPQCPPTMRWTDGALPTALDALDETMEHYPIDPRRVSLTGISMGGAGAWLLAAQQPQLFSALAPVCGWSPLSPAFIARRIGAMPVRIFHGSDDPIVPPSESRRMAARLGATATYTEFRGVGHNSWDRAYTTTDVVAWLIAQVNSASS